MQSDFSNFSKKKNYAIEKLCKFDNNLSPYDVDFKKPHFSKYSVFEDDIAAFKDESSPNLLSTAASSLSSLTIDEDDDNYNIKPNKAGLVKTKSNVINLFQLDKSIGQKHWRQNPIGSTTIESNEIDDNVTNKFLTNCFEKQVNTIEKLNNHSFINTCGCETEHKKKIIMAEYNTKKSNCNVINNCYLKNIQNIRSEAESNRKEADFKTELHYQHTREKLKDDCQTNEMFVNYHRAELDVCNNCDRSNGSKRYKEQGILEENRFLYESYRHNCKVCHSTDETNELNAYEEQLLDQCIRRGMAKITKRNISEIKPFSWDLNQICLTTKAMLKTHDENIIKEKQDDCGKQHILQRGLIRHVVNSQTK